MKTTLKNAVDKLCSNPTLWQVLHDILMDTISEDLILEEGEAVEVQTGDITISFTWDMISAVDNKTNDFVDLMTMKTDEEVVTFFKSALNTNPDSCEFCSFVDYSKCTKYKTFCIIRQQLFPNNKQCDVPPAEIKGYIKRRK